MNFHAMLCWVPLTGGRVLGLYKIGEFGEDEYVLSTTRMYEKSHRAYSRHLALPLLHERARLSFAVDAEEA